MPIYRITPHGGAPVLRQAGSINGATSRGLREFPAGLQSVEPVGLVELSQLAADGVPLPVAARQLLQVADAVRRERAKADARVQAVREKAREATRVKREEEQARKEAERSAEKAQRRAEKAAEKRRKLLAERRAMKQAQAAQEAAQRATAVPAQAEPHNPAVVLVVDPTDSRLPWE